MLAVISSGFERVLEKVSSRVGQKTVLVVAGIAAGAYIIRRNKESLMGAVLDKREYIHYRTAKGQSAGRMLYLLTFLFNNTMGCYKRLLPKLPLPNLNETLEVWYASVAPLLTHEQQEKTKADMRTFRTGIGCIAQAGLREYDKTVVNYTTESWNEKYLKTREPLHLKDSWVGISTSKPTHAPLEQLAIRIAGEREFRRLIQREALSPFYMGNKSVPVIVCMDQMKRLHGVSRLPGKDEDVMRLTLNSHHVILMIREQMFKITFEKEDGRALSHEEIYRQIVAAKAAAQMSAEPAVGRLTALPRNDLYPLYNDLKAQNPDSVETIETAMSVYSYDDQVTPRSPHDTADMLFMRQHNRWFQAGANCVFGTNGLGGGIYEHTFGEATAEAQQHTFIEAYLKTHKNKSCMLPIEFKPVHAQPLKFSVTQQQAEAIASVPLKHNAFKVYCERMPISRSCLKRLHWSVDAVIQMAILLTFYRLTGRLTSVYESGMTRLFAEGRTETINTSSMEAKAFVENPNILTLRAACDRHKETTTQALDGRGAYRHLSVLKWHMERAGLDTAFFDQEAWKLSLQMDISSSTTPTPDAMGGFPPPSKSGIGCSYIIQSDYLDFTLTGIDIDPETFYIRLRDTLCKTIEL